jgi:uncharacterized protein
MRVGIISDTHNLLRPQVFDHFAGVEHILHAGDVGDADILLELESIAPVTAVWGNTDGWALRGRLPEVAHLEIGGVRVVVIHGQQWGSPTPQKAARAFPDTDLVVFGHSHQAVIDRVGSVLTVNPGSAGPSRFGVAPTLAVGVLEDGAATAELIEVETPRPG